MEGAKNENNLGNVNTKEKLLNEKDGGKNNANVLPSDSNEAKKEIKENIEKENMNKDNKIDIEEEKVLKNMNNYNDKKEDLEKEKIKKENIKKEIYRTRLSSIKETSCRNVNNYKIIEEHIGEGTFGMVFKAEYIGDPIYAEKNRIPKKVALKKIKMEDSKEGFPITALREIMLMKKCHHENILEILEIVTSKIYTKNIKK